MKRPFSLVSLIGFCLLFACAGGLRAQDDLKFNVPYECNNGVTYVVHKCLTGPKGEMCYYQAEGQSERYNTRAAVVYQMTKMCKLKASSAPAAATAQASADLQLDTPYQCAGGVALTAFQCQKQNGQDSCMVRAEQNGKFLLQVPKPRAEIVAQVKACKAGTPFDPPYLAEFPSAAYVVQSMVVGNPKDNLTRGMGALYQLTEIVNVLSAQRGSGGLSPDEKKLLDSYNRMQTGLLQAAAQVLPGQHFDVATNPYHFAKSDPKFGFEGIPVWVTFLSPSMQARFAQIVGGNDSHYTAAVEQEKRKAMQLLQTSAEIAQSEQTMKKDPGSVATRRCMESGRSEMECLGEGLKTGLVDLAGGDPRGSIGLPGGDPGLRLTGVYSAGNFSLTFDQSAAGVACGKLLVLHYPYSVERSSNQLLVKVPIQPKPIVLSYKPDGKLTGPGPTDVAGRVVIGGATDSTSTGYEMQTQTTTTQKQIGANEVSNYNSDQVNRNGMEYSVNDQTTSTTMVPTTMHTYSVPTAPKTERCNVGVLPATGETGTVSSALTQVLGTQASKSSNKAPGLRLNGTYSVSGGLKIEFRSDSATLECGAALNSEGYSVVPEGGQLVVKFQHGAGPLSLVLQPNGTLTGSGAVDVNGRKVYRSQNGDIAYTPQNAQCSLGTLTPNK
jgi:hypothetical protein